MKKMKDVREQERRAVLNQIENVQNTLLHETHYDSKLNIIENALSIVDRNKQTLGVGCGR